MGCVYSCTSKTIKDGEAYAVSQRNGKVQVVQGPCSKIRMGNFFEKLDLVSAGEDQYLVVKFRDGRTEYRPGPVSLLQHPIDHISVTCQPAMRLRDHELIVVYRKIESKESGGATQVQRELVRGASIYIPKSASEWVHEFCWTGAAESDGDLQREQRKKIGALKFQKLQTNKGKTYIDVESVRTKDNALLTVQLMVFFSFNDIEKMLDSTNDPFGDIINATTADVVEWCAPQTFEEFMQATDNLNKLTLYTQLKIATESVGMSLEKVVFRGYRAPDTLQRLHDSAIEKRTSLALRKETEEEEQRLADFKLKRETERSEQQARLEMSRKDHEIAMAAKAVNSEQELRKQEFEMEMKRLREIKAIDKNANIGEYLIAKEGRLPPVVQCGTMQSGTAGNGTQREAASALSGWLRM